MNILVPHEHQERPCDDGFWRVAAKLEHNLQIPHLKLSVTERDQERQVAVHCPHGRE